MNQDDDEVERILNDQNKDKETVRSIGEGDEEEPKATEVPDENKSQLSELKSQGK